jgi:glutamyl-Q tRNA(Asp) synthetase
MPDTTRFAPSPSGPLHLGHALAAVVAHDLARAGGGQFHLRLEDLDVGRCEPRHAAAISSDLAWLGLAVDGEALVQSARVDLYRHHLDALTDRGLTYPCFCTRGDIAAEVARMRTAPHGTTAGPEGPLYPGTCRGLTAAERAARLAAGQVPAIRLDVAACRRLGGTEALRFFESGRGPTGQHGWIMVEPGLLGDVVLGRRDIGVSYHLACVVDDAAQRVTLVSRGNDLFAAAHLQRLLQHLLGIEPPAYHHHRLLRDPQGRRLAKRDGASSLARLRAQGIEGVEVAGLLRAGNEERLLTTAREAVGDIDTRENTGPKGAAD